MFYTILYDRIYEFSIFIYKSILIIIFNLNIVSDLALSIIYKLIVQIKYFYINCLRAILKIRGWLFYCG